MKVSEGVFRSTLAYHKMSTSLGLVVLIVLMAMEPVRSDSCGFSGLFAFGDSLTDTGNAVTAYPQAFLGLVLPYGETYFGQPSSRASDGRLTIDFVGRNSLHSILLITNICSYRDHTVHRIPTKFHLLAPL